MSSLANVLRQTDIFFELAASELELIAVLCSESRFNAGEVVFEEHSTGDELYIILQGEVEIQVDPTVVGAESSQPMNVVTITTLRRGQSFGEIALVDQGLRSATARCSVNNTVMVTIPRNKLITLCETYPQLGFRLMRNLATDLALKIRNSDLRFREELLYGHRQRV